MKTECLIAAATASESLVVFDVFLPNSGLRREIASHYRILDVGKAQVSTEASDEVRLNRIDHSAPFPPWSGSNGLCLFC